MGQSEKSEWLRIRLSLVDVVVDSIVLDVAQNVFRYLGTVGQRTEILCLLPEVFLEEKTNETKTAVPPH